MLSGQVTIAGLVKSDNGKKLPRANIVLKGTNLGVVSDNDGQFTLDISEEEISIPPAEFESELSLPSSDFQKIIRDMINIGENIEIKSIGSQLILNCLGDFASQETILGETNNGLKFNQISPQELPIQGVYSLKYLVLFTKCTGLCNQINLYIKNDYPLVIRYAVASLGNIKLCLAPNTN